MYKITIISLISNLRIHCFVVKFKKIPPELSQIHIEYPGLWPKPTDRTPFISAGRYSRGMAEDDSSEKAVPLIKTRQSRTTDFHIMYTIKP